jgi:hypothetical protein
MGLCKEAGQEAALHLRRPATTEEGRVGDEAAPTLARRGAAEQGGPVVPDAEEDFEEHVVPERCGRRRDLFHGHLLVRRICLIDRSALDTFFV